MAAKKRPRPRKKTPKRFQFQLGWSGLFGVTVVIFCILVWMFMLGVWAGQTILLPSKETQRSSGYTSTHLETESESDLPTVHANGKKRKVESR